MENSSTAWKSGACKALWRSQEKKQKAKTDGAHVKRKERPAKKMENSSTAWKRRTWAAIWRPEEKMQKHPEKHPKNRKKQRSSPSKNKVLKESLWRNQKVVCRPKEWDPWMHKRRTWWTCQINLLWWNKKWCITSDAESETSDETKGKFPTWFPYKERGWWHGQESASREQPRRGRCLL